MNILPNILSSFRIIVAPFFLVFAWKGYRNLFIVLFASSLLTDAVDGFISRRFNAASTLGTKLDSLGDMAVYLTVPVCAWWLWPEKIRDVAPFFFIAVGAYVVPLIAGYIKFKRLPSYHTIGAKTAAVFMSLAVLILFLTDITWIFQIAAIFQALEACEEVLITIRLPELQDNVKSLWHLNRQMGSNQ